MKDKAGVAAAVKLFSKKLAALDTRMLQREKRLTGLLKRLHSEKLKKMDAFIRG